MSGGDYFGKKYLFFIIIIIVIVNFSGYKAFEGQIFLIFHCFSPLHAEPISPALFFFFSTLFGHSQHHLHLSQSRFASAPSSSFTTLCCYESLSLPSASPASSISTDDPCRRQCKSPASHLLPLQVLEFLQLQCSSPLGHQLLHSFSSSKLVSSAALLLSCVEVSMTVCVCVPCANQKHRFLILYSAQHLSIDFIISFFLESDCCNPFICLCFDLSLLHLLVLLSS